MAPRGRRIASAGRGRGPANSGATTNNQEQSLAYTPPNRGHNDRPVDDQQHPPPGAPAPAPGPSRGHRGKRSHHRSRGTRGTTRGTTPRGQIATRNVYHHHHHQQQSITTHHTVSTRLQLSPNRLRQFPRGSCGPFITLRLAKRAAQSSRTPSTESPPFLSSAETSSHSDDQGPSPETPAPDLASPEIFTLVDPPGAGLINPQPGPVDTVEVAAGHFRRSPGILESGHFQLAPHTVEQGHFPDLPHTVGPAAIVANILGQSLAVATGDRAAASVRQNYDCDYDNNKTMAPVKDTSNVHMTIKDIIQHLSEIQIQTHGYVPETQDLMVDKMTDLAQSLARLQSLTSPTASPNNHIHDIQIAPEIVDYVDDGRNPDIFTRDFVENVQRGNAVINGKQQAFRDFTEIYAKALKEGVPGVSRQVDRVLENAGFQTDHGDDANGSKALNS